MTDLALPDLDAIRSAQRRIAGHVEHTPSRISRWLSELTGATVYLKLEIEQPTGSFKVRGACNAIRAAAEGGEVTGVTTASTGNHARAVAHMGRRFGLPVTAFLARTVPDYRARALEQLGAVVDHTSHDQTAAITAALALANDRGYLFVPPFDHPDVISGQGTIGLELTHDLPPLDAVVVPVSGGGLSGGIGLAVKAVTHGTQVVGVCAERADTMYRSLRAGHPVSIDEVDTVATSLLGDLGPHNRYTFRIARQVIDEIDTVSEEQLRTALETLRRHDELLVEGAAAAGVAFLQSDPDRWRGSRLAVVITGNSRAPAAA
ncbi:pyridoxal-phosphate dependent enzyme [Flexivirga oryzae]|uniref:Threonine dehydratase n=1 Tax=Flexivirga oryzae TaxID=1794944 RepID=A0A839N5T0_9MICO|nr:pyridoxal-phosphate dependent enzyme [Flexivirga oryzae]MBB2891404.1 threonine dehydratase [Flexivirga oryzae]